MRIVHAVIDGIDIKLNVMETAGEFREGARILNRQLALTEGLLFAFGGSSLLSFENSGVDQDLNLLFFDENSPVVREIKTLKANCSDVVTSESFCSSAIELRADFCKAMGIKEGSIVSITKIED
jgi:uncharacterized membrane protein (UPF0127 family)